VKILGIDSSTRICSLGLIEEHNILTEYNINSYYQKTSSILVPAIKTMLEGVNLTLAEIDGIAVAIGPGSFTGLRIGLGVAKGLCYATTSLPLWGISTLDALAYSLRGVPSLICPLLLSTREEIFSAVFRGGEDSLEKIIDYDCSDMDTLLAKISFLKEKIIFIGEGLKKYQKAIQERLNQEALFIDSPLAFPRGVNIAFLGLEKLQKGEKEDIHTLSPLYLRKSQAEMVREKKTTEI